jgi:pyruvate-ferredoxin/flavodoxin oxidoreductase
VPFLHFFDGFRTSHEVSKIEMVTDEVIRQMINDEFVMAHRQRAMNPEKPVLRGTAQNPDVFFQAREACNPFYAKCADVTARVMEKFAGITGREYKPFQYVGDPNAERVVVLMGSGCETAHETVEYLNEHGAKVGLVKVRLYRPFCMKRFIEALPASVKAIAVLDRTKEPGALGEPLYLDVVAALNESLASGSSKLKAMPKVVGGRYGLSSKEFTPASASRMT